MKIKQYKVKISYEFATMDHFDVKDFQRILSPEIYAHIRKLSESNDMLHGAVHTEIESVED